MTTSTLTRCKRCPGMMVDSYDGEMVCVNCGHVVYPYAPLPHMAQPYEGAYQDTGCEASPLCSECPLPQCKYDAPLWYVSYRRNSRDARIVRELRRTRNPRQTALAFDVSIKTVQRAVQRCRQPVQRRMAV